ncbi:MAG: hypothetical protein BYD32DRAFT_82182 [Podila humilis]|nr:MAG: hypothetical protein BYD32DRAFT_82182 [Podila humilis]
MREKRQTNVIMYSSMPLSLLSLATHLSVSLFIFPLSFPFLSFSLHPLLSFQFISFISIPIQSLLISFLTKGQSQYLVFIFISPPPFLALSLSLSPHTATSLSHSFSHIALFSYIQIHLFLSLCYPLPYPCSPFPALEQKDHTVDS